MIRNVVVPPLLEPVSLAEAKLHLRVDGDAENTLVASLIAAARERVEAFTQRTLMRQTLDLVFDGFEDELVLGAPLASVASISYVDPDGVLQTLPGTEYAVVAPTAEPAPPGLVRPAAGKVWPATAVRRDAVTVRAVLGQAEASKVPASIRAAILLLVGDLFANREAQLPAGSVAPNPTVEALLQPWRIGIVA